MEALKNTIRVARANFENVAFLKFLTVAGIYIFAGGGLLWLIAGFLPMNPSVYFVKTLLAANGRLLLAIGLFFAVVKGDELLLMIFSAVISFGAFVMMIVELAAFGYYAEFESWLFFVLFGGLVALVIIFGDKFKQMRADAKANAAARAAAQQVQLIACPNCGGPVPFTAKFCPNCAAPNPAQVHQAQQTQLVACSNCGAQMPSAAKFCPNCAAPNPAQAQQAPAAKPAAPKKAVKPADKACVNCSEKIPASAAFCGKCGAKQ
jgi:RNA polymerase subunit RPABC4/transcription elongation factor Spt4